MKATVLTTLLCCATATLLAQNPMREGRWEITSQMDMPGMPMKMPKTKMVQCVTKKDLAEPGGGVPSGPSGRATSENCKMSDHKVDGNKITWKMACTAPQEMTGTGEIVVNGDNYNGAMTMTTAKGTMTIKYSAKRLGDCTE